MKKFAQILEGKLHWKFEAEELPEFAPDILIIDITGINPAPQEGWDWIGSKFIARELPLSVVKDRMWGGIKAKRDAIKTGGVKIGTKWYHSDETSRTQYIGLLRMADAAVAAGGTGSTTLQYGGQDIQWKTMDGSFIKMTVQRANDVFNAVGGLDFMAFAAAETHRVAMEASADPSSYDFANGWPATFGG